MVEKINLDQGLGRKEIKQILRRYNALNAHRIKRLEADMSGVQKDFLNILPLLFHINYPTLPGFVSNDVPAGMADYQPDRNTLLIAKKFGRSFEYKRKALRTIPIQGLYLMGSIGSVGQTTDSDLDFWLCYSHDLKRNQINLLQKKAHLIEKFGEELGLEVHFFLMDAVAFKSGETLSLSSESSGSAQHHLLLEEFYRTSILVSGRPPLWWIVPPEEDDRYQSFTDEMIKKRFIDPIDWLDFGGMDDVPADEFFGAAHWQLYKGIESPYKAILKILLMESYAADFPKISWLSQVTKQAIFNGDENVTDIDPYILIYRQVEAYLTAHMQDERLDLARRCFYFKVNMPLSKTSKSNYDWKRKRLERLVQEWQWSDLEIRRLDSRDKWKIEEVNRERNILVRELTHSYRVLMNFARNNTATGGIDPLELNLLGRKLYAALERRPGKIDFINPGISKEMCEPRLCFRFESRKDQIRWQLFRDDPNVNETVKVLKTTPSLLEMLAWCHCNDIIEPGIQIIIRPFDAPVPITDLRQILDLINALIPDHHAIKPDIEQLHKKPHTVNAMAFVNIGFDPMAEFSRAGLQLTSRRSNPLSFSAKHINLAKRLDFLSTNSWGEIETSTHIGTEGLLEGFSKFLQSIQLCDTYPKPSVNGFGSSRSHNIASRVEKVLAELVDCFFESGPGLNSRFVLEIEDGYAVFYHRNDNFHHVMTSSQKELFEMLGESQHEFSPVVIESHSLANHPLPVIMQNNRPDVIQLYSLQASKGIQIYVVDEFGALFYQLVKNADERHLLIQQQRFIDSLSNRRALLSVDNVSQILHYSPEFYRLAQTDMKTWYFEPARLPAISSAGEYTEIELQIGNSSGQETNKNSLNNYSIICNEHEFNYIELRNDIYAAIAGHILKMRKNASRYPVYLTSIAPTGMADEKLWSTIKMFNFKKRLENQINIALQQLAS